MTRGSYQTLPGDSNRNLRRTRFGESPSGHQADFHGASTRIRCGIASGNRNPIDFDADRKTPPHAECGKKSVTGISGGSLRGLRDQAGSTDSLCGFAGLGVPDSVLSPAAFARNRAIDRLPVQKSANPQRVPGSRKIPRTTRFRSAARFRCRASGKQRGIGIFGRTQGSAVAAKPNGAIARKPIRSGKSTVRKISRRFGGSTRIGILAALRQF